MHRHIYHFSGHVQGVGFRYTAQNVALQHNVHGYVRNLNDGRVELVMEGDDHEVQEVVEGVQQRMRPFVRNISSQIAPATGEFEQFCIRH